MTDELKPVRCGCGGEAEVRGFENIDDSISIYVCCSKCHTSTVSFTGEQAEENAIEAWNRAMGASKSEFAITKGYWMATYDGLHCSVCNYKCESTALPNVCPHCGTSMKTANEWSL